MRLSRKKVLAEARKLVNEQGLDALTTRRLGERLGVKGPALYRHFSSMQELVTALGESFFADAGLPRADHGWRAWLEQQARQTRREILSCRDGARIIAMAKPDLSGSLDRLLQPLTSAGFDTAEALLASHLVGRFVIGWTMSEQEYGGQIPPETANLDPEASFEFALQSLLAGLEVRLTAKKLVPSPLTRPAQDATAEPD